MDLEREGAIVSSRKLHREGSSNHRAADISGYARRSYIRGIEIYNYVLTFFFFNFFKSNIVLLQENELS